MKRFWNTAVAARQADGSFAVLLDGRPVRLPGEATTTLRLGSAAVAEAIASEWAAAGGGQGGAFTAEDVPLTRLAGTAQARIAPDPAPTIQGLAAYGETDLLCYRAPERALAARQAEAWQPLLDWVALTHDAPLVATTGLMPVPQPAASLAALKAALAGLTPLSLAALSAAVPPLGSLVLGLTLQAGRIDAEAAMALATLDEMHQERLWGQDAEALARRQRMASDVGLAARLLALEQIA
ncbi:ATP12 family protein [Plastoroseomonas hellenica]|uniref:ATP12 family protein n=1 Tax=Plastoroseomonas hellenica TaxID=2687306 RepID=UPI001BAE253C|nr:ATP12 family protein [Plastoroseomonas hellenica]MBR0645764.1 chaperone, ATP12 [Plastoroseomonas hellenica]